MLPYRIKNKDFPRLALGLVGRQVATGLPVFGHVRWAGDVILERKKWTLEDFPSRRFGLYSSCKANRVAPKAGRGFSKIFQLESSWKGLEPKRKEQMDTDELLERRRLLRNKGSAYLETTLEVEFHWISPKERSALFHSLLNVLRNGKDGTPHKYTLLMPPLKKAHQLLSRDAKHRNWNGYIWENV